MSWSVIEGDALTRLREMPAESVQCVVTSPPYWGLRDYGTATWDGGDANCDHAKPRPIDDPTSTLESCHANTNHQAEPAYRVDLLHRSGECLCGAFAKRAELPELRLWFPETAARIEALEQRARDAGLSNCYWGGQTASRIPTFNDAQGELALCTSCDPLGA